MKCEVVKTPLRCNLMQMDRLQVINLHWRNVAGSCRLNSVTWSKVMHCAPPHEVLHAADSAHSVLTCICLLIISLHVPVWRLCAWDANFSTLKRSRKRNFCLPKPSHSCQRADGKHLQVPQVKDVASLKVHKNKAGMSGNSGPINMQQHAARQE